MIANHDTAAAVLLQKILCDCVRSSAMWVLGLFVLLPWQVLITNKHLGTAWASIKSVDVYDGWQTR